MADQIRWQSVGPDGASNDLVDESHPFPVQDVLNKNVAQYWRTGQISVGTAATRIVSANPDRKGVVITQITGAQIVYLGPDNTVAATTGAYLGATAGNSYATNYQGEIWGLAASSAQTVSWSEESF